MASQDLSSGDGRPTIWILVTALSVGGAERTIVNLANNLDSDRYRVVVWTIFDTNPLAEQLEDVPHRSLDVRSSNPDDPNKVSGAANPLDYVRAPIRFLQAVRRERPDVVHSFLFLDNLIARTAGVVSPETSVVDGIRGYHNDSRPVAHGLDRLSLWLSDTTVSNSEAGAAYLREQGVAPDAIQVVPNGRDLDVYRNGSAAGLRDELDIPDSAPVIGTIGRLVERKGHFELLDAWRSVLSAHPDAHLVIVGHGPERDALVDRARDYGVESRVHLTGSRDDVPDLLAMFDVFVFPSHWEGLPGALLEAMAAGLPIVATVIDGNDELVTHGETGLLVPPHESAPLAAGLSKLLDEPETATALGAAAQADAYDRFTIDEMVDRFEEVYATVCGREPASTRLEVPA